MMGTQLAIARDLPDPVDDPDSLIGYFRSTGDYGIRIHDGGSSMIVIDFCPWCRARLRPKDRHALVRSGRLTTEALAPGLKPRSRMLPGGSMPGRRIEP
jgi:hypothetical protein